MLRFVLVLLVFGADVLALLSVLGSPLPRRTRFRWVAAIVGLPVLGIVLWWRRRPARIGRLS